MPIIDLTINNATTDATDELRFEIYTRHAEGGPSLHAATLVVNNDEEGRQTQTFTYDNVEHVQSFYTFPIAVLRALEHTENKLDQQLTYFDSTCWDRYPHAMIVANNAFRFAETEHSYTLDPLMIAPAA